MRYHVNASVAGLQYGDVIDIEDPLLWQAEIDAGYLSPLDEPADATPEAPPEVVPEAEAPPA